MGILVRNTKKHPSGRVEYRRAFPPELWPFIPRKDGKPGRGSRELKVSLGLEGTAGFLSRYEQAAQHFDAIVQKARKLQAGAYDVLDPPKLAYLGKLFEVEWLEREERDRWAKGPEWVERLRNGWDWLLPDFRTWKATGDLDEIEEYWGTQASALLQEQGLVLDPADDDGFRALCRELNDAMLRVGGASLARMKGKSVPTPERPQEPSRAALNGTRLPLLSLFEDYAAKQGMKASTRIEWRGYIKHLQGFLGHDDARRLTATELREWRDKLLEEPTKQGKKRSAVTVNDKYLVPVRAMLRYAVDERLLAENVAAEVKVRKPKQPKLRDPAFTPTEAKAILSATLKPASANLSPEHALARRWIPWLCAYSGARVGEVAQLRKQDVYEAEGVWVMNITPEAGTVKTGEAREVPLHPHVIQQGFLCILKGRSDGPLFYAPSRTRKATDGNRHHKKVGERLAQWVREDVGLKDPKLQPNHAWRHRFKRLSYDVGMEERMADAIQGHAPVTAGRGYGPPSVQAKASAIRLLPWVSLEDEKEAA